MSEQSNDEVELLTPAEVRAMFEDVQAHGEWAAVNEFSFRNGLAADRWKPERIVATLVVFMAMDMQRRAEGQATE